MNTFCKKTICFIAGLMAGITIYAQESNWGSFHLPDGGIFGVEVDYSQAKLAGLSYEECVDLYPSFESDIQEANSELIHHLNETFGDSSYPRLNVLHFSPKLEGREYVIVFSILSATNKGAMVIDVQFKDKEDNNVATITGLKSRGSKYGDLANLIGDGFEKVADEFYSVVQDAMKHNKI